MTEQFLRLVSYRTGLPVYIKPDTIQGILTMLDVEKDLVYSTIIFGGGSQLTVKETPSKIFGLMKTITKNLGNGDSKKYFVINRII